ncbi:Bestrophin/UPF0187 [Gorgonomyces haynaldii]|nr:Bestrophin/UPF0187 [Gorgonomyces haynaldii]
MPRASYAKHFRHAIQKHTVLQHILPIMFITTTYAFGITYLYKHGYPVQIDDKLTSILGVVVAFLLGFRTNRAFDRYWLGAQQWSQLAINTRNATRLFWTSIKSNSMTRMQKDMFSLLLSVVLATKCALQGQDGRQDPHIKKLIPKRDFTETLFESNNAPMTLPVELIHVLGRYVKHLRKRELIEAEDVHSMQQALNAMMDSVTKFELLTHVPMPKAFQVHMKHILMLYFATLPPQLVKNFGWQAVPVVCMLSFVYYGADAISDMLVDPFGSDETDLPLDYFIETLKSDIHGFLDME